MAAKEPNEPKSPSKTPPDSDTSEEETIDPSYITLVEERQYSTIKGSAIATKIAISHSHAQASPTVERGPACRTRIKKLPKDKAVDKSTQSLRKIKTQSNL